MRAMARMLGRSPATVSRELARNCRFDSYASMPSQALSVARRIAGRAPAKLDPQGITWRIVLTLLDWKLSPQQILGTLRRMYPDDPSTRVSHEAIHGDLRTPVQKAASPVCATIAPIACREAGAPTGAGGFPTWSASMCARPKWMTA